MTSLSARKTESEIIVRGRSEGVDELSGDLRELAEATKPAVRATEKTEKVTTSAARAFSRLENKYDKLTALEKRRTRELTQLTRAQADGVVTGQRYEKILNEINRSYKDQERRLRDARDAQSRYNRETSRSEQILRSARGAALGFVSAFSVGAITNFSRTSTRELDALAKAARNLDGIESAGFLQGSRFSLGQVGFDEGEADKIITTLNKRVGELREGFGALLQPIRRIAPELEAPLRAAATAEERFDVFVGGLERIEDRSERAALAAAGLDASFGNRFGAAVEEGVDGLRAMRNQADDLGLVIDGEVLERAEKLNDEFTISSKIVATDLKRAFVELAPAIQAAVDVSAGLATKSAAAPAQFAFRFGGADALESVDQARLLERSIQRQIDFERNVPNLPGLSGLIIGNLEKDLEAVRARIAELRAEQSAYNGEIETTGQLLAALEGVSAAPDARQVTALRARRAELEALINAAGESESAFRRLKEEQEASAAARAEGLSGRDAEAFKALTVEIKAQERELARLTGGFKDLGKAKAQASEFDPIGQVTADNDTLRTLIEAGRQGEEALRAAQRTEEVSRRVAAIRVDAARQSKELTEDEVQALTKLVEENVLLSREAGGFGLGGGADAARDFGEELKRAMMFAGEAFFFDFRTRGKDSIADLADEFKRLFSRRAVAGLFDALQGGDSALANDLQKRLSGLPGGIGDFFGGVGGRLDQFVRSTLGLENVSSAIGIGFLGNAAGGFLGDLIGLERGTGSRGALTGATTGFALGGPIGAGIGALVGGVKNLFGNKTGVADFDLASGEIAFRQQSKRDSVNQRRDEILNSSVQAVQAITEALGGEFREGVSLTASVRKDRARVVLLDTATRREISEKIQTDFNDVSGAVSAAIKLSLEGAVTGVDDELLNFAQAMATAGEAPEGIVESVQTYRAALERVKEPVDEFAQRTRDMTELFDPLIAKFESLGLSTADLEKALRERIDDIAEDRNRRTREQDLAVNNPLLGQVESLIRNQDRETSGAREAAQAGGNVDLGLLERVQRDQVLALFNLDERVRSAADPAAGSLLNIADRQSQELSALRAAIDAGRASLDDLARLEFVQGAERAEAFRSLSDEDQARLAGSDALKEFESISGKIGSNFTILNDQLEDFDRNLGDVTDSLRESISVGQRQVDDFNRAINLFDVNGTPNQRLDNLRVQFGDLVERALAGDGAARDSVIQVGDELRRRSLEINASGPQGQADEALVRQGLIQVRDAVADEVSLNQRQLEAAERTADGVEALIAVIADRGVNASDLRAAAQDFSADFDIRDTALALADLLDQRAGAADASAAALAAASPSQVFASLGAPSNDNALINGLTASPLFSAPSPPAPPSSGAAGGFGVDAALASSLLATQSRFDGEDAQADMLFALQKIAAGVQEMIGQLNQQGVDQRRYAKNRESQLTRIADNQTVNAL